MAVSLPLEIAGERMEAFADRALYWPRRERLLVADLHLGKADIFRRAGIGLPSGGTAHDLARIDRLFALSGAKELWILGDVLHGAALDTAWRATWNAWRERAPGRRLAALAGNHDRALANAGLDIDLLGTTVDDPPFALRHEPETGTGLHVVAGHLHPCVQLPGLGARRWPAFWMRDGGTVLPAFSAFTGGVGVLPGPGERIAVCVRDTITLIRGPAR